MWTEINVDAMVGPTHHYGGLGVGNLASQQHAGLTSHPRGAVLEGLRKAALVASLGVPQYLLPPPVRPRLNWLQQLGLETHTASDLRQALHLAPQAFSAAFSSAFMWAANSAMVSAACDTRDQKLHVTPANLISSWHRGAEAEERRTDLAQLFSGLSQAVVHPPLPAIVPLRDEGGANHMRLCDASLQHGFHLFVYGDEGGSTLAVDCHFLPRQTRASCEAIARRHQLDPQRTFFLRQHPAAIAAGAFHNDVVATSHEHLLIYHQRAFIDAQSELERLELSFFQVTGQPMLRIEIPETQLSLEQAVESYFFNSQIVTPRPSSTTATDPRMVLISPSQCHAIPAAAACVERLVASSDNPIDAVHFVSLQQSMAGGGGPACLRLRVLLSQVDLNKLPAAQRMTRQLEECLLSFIERWYPETLQLGDLCEPTYVAHLSRVSQRLREDVFGCK